MAFLLVKFHEIGPCHMLPTNLGNRSSKKKNYLPALRSLWQRSIDGKSISKFLPLWRCINRGVVKSNLSICLIHLKNGALYRIHLLTPSRTTLLLHYNGETFTSFHRISGKDDQLEDLRQFQLPTCLHCLATFLCCTRVLHGSQWRIQN